MSSMCVFLIRSFHASEKLHASHPSLIRQSKTECRLSTGVYTSCALQGLRAFGAQATRPPYWWTIFITPKHLVLQERTVDHNCFAPCWGQSYSGHEEEWGHHDGHGGLFNKLRLSLFKIRDAGYVHLPDKTWSQQGEVGKVHKGQCAMTHEEDSHWIRAYIKK